MGDDSGASASHARRRVRRYPVGTPARSARRSRNLRRGDDRRHFRSRDHFRHGPAAPQRAQRSVRCPRRGAAVRQASAAARRCDRRPQRGDRRHPADHHGSDRAAGQLRRRLARRRTPLRGQHQTHLPQRQSWGLRGSAARVPNRRDRRSPGGGRRDCTAFRQRRLGVALPCRSPRRPCRSPGKESRDDGAGPLGEGRVDRPGALPRCRRRQFKAPGPPLRIARHHRASRGQTRCAARQPRLQES